MVSVWRVTRVRDGLLSVGIRAGLRLLPVTLGVRVAGVLPERGRVGLLLLPVVAVRVREKRGGRALPTVGGAGGVNSGQGGVVAHW